MVAYACMSNGTLTLYYGLWSDAVTKADTRVGQRIYEDLPGKEYLPWNDIRTQVQKLVFDSSFSSYAPEDISFWFSGMSGITEVDLRNLITTNVKACDALFLDCTNLKTIYDAGNFNDKAGEGKEMFLNCINLVGGNGTPYDAHYTNLKYAHIDVQGNPGYFTQYVEPVNPPAYTYKLLFSSDDINNVENMYKSIIEPSNEQSYEFVFSYKNIEEAMGIKGQDPKSLKGLNF